MNDVAAAFKLIRNWRRYEAVLHPRTIRFLWHWLRGSTHLPYPPLKLHLEPTSLCNLKCPMCPQSIGANTVNGFMDMDVYRHILEQVRGHVLEVNLFFRGEPMMHKNLGEMTTLAHEAGIAVHVNTNATTLRAKQTAALLDAKLDKLTVSFDGADKDTYERMRVGAKFELTLKNVREFLLEKQRRQVRYPYTVMQVILPYDPTAARPETPAGMRELFAGLPVDEYDTRWAHGWAGTMMENPVAQPEQYGPNYHPCNWLWKSMAIYWNGEVVSCCADFAGEQVVGNLMEQSLMEVWNGPELVKLRRLQVEGRYQEASLCSGCDALWQQDSASWKVFDGIGAAADRIVPSEATWRRKTVPPSPAVVSTERTITPNEAPFSEPVPSLNGDTLASGEPVKPSSGSNGNNA